MLILNDFSTNFTELQWNNDATLYYGVLLNSYITQRLFEIYSYCDNYIIMWDNNEVVLPKKYQDCIWIDFLNVACNKYFLANESGLGNRNGQDNLSLQKYDSYELFIYEQLNKVLIKKKLENKKRAALSKGERPKKSLLPFLANN